jgi:hypothetical protein
MVMEFKILVNQEFLELLLTFLMLLEILFWIQTETQ